MPYIKCPECNDKTDLGKKYCNNCGFPIYKLEEKKEEIKLIGRKSNNFADDLKRFILEKKSLLIIGVVIVVIIIICSNFYNRYDADVVGDYDTYDSNSYESSDYYDMVRDISISNVRVEHNSVFTEASGTVTNNGNKTYDFIKVKGSFVNSSGTTVDTDWTYAVGAEGLAPGESSTFTLMIDKNSSVWNCNVTIFE